MREENELWRPHVGDFAWPTVGLTAVVVGLVAVAWSGLVPLWAGTLLATVAAYFAFTVMHEASHGNIHGKHRRFSKVGEAIGWLVSVTLFAPYSAFRVLHLRHHAHTNHPEKDPDYFVAGSLLNALARCFMTVPVYYHEFFLGKTAQTTAAKKERINALLGFGFYVVLLVTLCALGLWREVLALWLGPAVLATGALAVVFDWLPHHPHQSRKRYQDTRAIDLRPLDYLCFGQNLHLVHHLFPRVPFYRYRRVFDAGRPHFETKGANIVDPLARSVDVRPRPTE